MFDLNHFKNLFSPGNRYFDKDITIEEYFKVVPKDKRPHFDSYEELYNHAVMVVGKKSFGQITAGQDDFFHELTTDECLIAILVGALAYAVAREVDANGSKLEAAIDKVLPKDYDRNNPFDTKQGYGHRIFGHDPITFGIKDIPGDTLINVKNVTTGKRGLIKIGEFIGSGVDSNVSMWELIWKFYGNDISPVSGVVNSIKHIIVHFGKDLLTPAGLPLPLTTLLNKYEYNDYLQGHIISYKNSWAQKLSKYHLKLKASDFASLIFIEAILEVYSRSKKYGEQVTGFKQDIKMIAMGTCISLSMATIILGEGQQACVKGNKPEIPGSNINVLLTGAYIKILVEEMTSIATARKEIDRQYEEL